MPKITWVGEDHLHVDAEGNSTGVPPAHTTWKGIKFPKGEAVEVTDAHILAKAKGNPFFKIGESKPEKPTLSLPEAK